MSSADARPQLVERRVRGQVEEALQDTPVVVIQGARLWALPIEALWRL